MGNEIVRATDLSQLYELGRVFYESGLFVDTQGEAQAIVRILAGNELGFPPLTSMNGVHIIKGKVALSANLMAAAIKRSGKYTYRVLTMDPALCEIEFFERENGQWVSIGVSPFSLEDARKAGTQNLAKFPRNMLFARAMSNGAKWFCPDVFGGPIYTPEELGELVDESGDLIQIDSPPAVALPAPERVPTHCADCSQPIANYETPKGEMIGASGVTTRNIARYGRALCMSCATKIDIRPRLDELDKALVYLNVSHGTFQDEWSLDELKRWGTSAGNAINKRLEQLSEQSGVALDDSLPFADKMRQGLEMMEAVTRAELADEPAH